MAPIPIAAIAASYYIDSVYYHRLIDTGHVIILLKIVLHIVYMNMN
jgi:hypothetical protein